jgi:hypothetical protein
VLDFAKQNGIVMLSFPPHCSHKLQPLDRSVFGPFKRFAAVAQDAWMKNHPGQSMTIYDIPEIVAIALPVATTPTNICSGFRVSGIFPFDRNIFAEEEYVPSYSTDRPDPTVTPSLDDADSGNLANRAALSSTPAVMNDPLPINNCFVNRCHNIKDPASLEIEVELSDIDNNQCGTRTYITVPVVVAGSSAIGMTDTDTAASTSSQLTYASTAATVSSSVNSVISPEMIRPFMKAQPRKSSHRARRKGQTRILTDTPVKEQLEIFQRERNSRKTKVSVTNTASKRKRIFAMLSTVESEISDGPIAGKVSNILQAADTAVRQKAKKTARKKLTVKSRKGQTIANDDDTPCAMCGKRCNEPPLEDWKQCPSCKEWFHERCCPDDTDTCYTCLG